MMRFLRTTKGILSFVGSLLGVVVGLVYGGRGPCEIRVNSPQTVIVDNCPPASSSSPEPKQTVAESDPKQDPKDTKAEKPISRTKRRQANHTKEVQEEWSYQVPQEEPKTWFDSRASRIITVQPKPQVTTFTRQQSQSQSVSYANNTTRIVIYQQQQRPVIFVKPQSVIRYSTSPVRLFRR